MPSFQHAKYYTTVAPLIALIAAYSCTAQVTEAPAACVPDTYQPSPAPIVDLPEVMPADFYFVYDHTFQAYDSKRRIYTQSPSPWSGPPKDFELRLTDAELTMIHDNFRKNNLSRIRTQYDQNSDHCGGGLYVSHPTAASIEFGTLGKAKKMATSGVYRYYETDPDFRAFNSATNFLMNLIFEKSKSLPLAPWDCISQ